MPVQINITGADAAESLRELSALAVGLTGGVQIPAPVVAPETPKRKKKEEPAPEKPVETNPEADPIQEPPASEDVGPDDDGDDEPIPDVVELRALATEKGKMAGRDKVKALLTEYGSDNITNIPENKRAAFKRDLEALA